MLPDDQWHLDKRVTLTVISLLAVQTATLLGWGISVERRIAVMETQIVQTANDNTRQDVIVNESVRLLREEIRDLKSDIRNLSQQLNNHNGATRPR